MPKLALLMDLPEGKLPGFYAQLVKGLAGRVQLFDRDKELLILANPHDRDQVLELMKHYHVNTEEMVIHLLPAEAELFRFFSDYGFTSRAEHHYLYEHLIAYFHFVDSDDPHAEPIQAIQQMEEHLIAKFHVAEQVHYAVDLQLLELMFQIAKAYHCFIEQSNDLPI